MVKELRKNKKGSIIDLLFIMVVLLFFGIAVLIGTKIGTEVNDHIQASNDFNAAGKSASQASLNNFIGSVDNSYLLIVIFLGIATLVLAALVRIHPIFIPFFFIGWILMIFLSGVFSNIYQEMAATTALATTANNLTFITNILAVLPMVIGVFGIILMIVMYKLWSVSTE